MKKTEELKGTKNKGITLIALVITIIVLLILAGVTIASITGENGILSKAIEAETNTELAEIEEVANLAYTSKLMDNLIGADVPMADIVSQLQAEGYEIYAQPGDGITGIKLDSNSLTIEKDGTAVINVSYEGNTEGMQYYAVVKGKYYLITKDANGIKVSREESKINSSAQEELKAESSNTTYVKVENVSGNTINLKAGDSIGTATITVSYGSYTDTCIVTVVTTPTEDSVADASTSFSTGYGTIDIIWLSGETNTVSSTPNAPILESNGESMTPVTWTYDENSKTWTEDGTASGNWYSYNSVSNRGADGKLEDNTTSKWANAKTKNGSYFVWIPRYAYRITYYDSETSTIPTGYYDGWGMWKNDGTLKYKLDEGIETVDYKGSKYIVHPAFCNGSDKGYANGEWDANLEGFWFAKYEMSGSSSELKSEPNVSSLKSTSIGDQYVYARQAKFGYTGTSKTMNSNNTDYTYTNYMDSHLVKNSEWGAVAYLTQSQYGRNGNEISVNQCNGYYTGAGRGEGDNKIYNSTYSWSSATDAQKYNGEIGVLSSTTGNVYGIYDMSGGAWDRAAGYDRLGSSTYVDDSSFGKKMTQEAKDSEGNYISTKYVTAYENGTSLSANNVYDICKVGDAIKEVRTGNNTAHAWFNDYSVFAYSSAPFFRRGGSYSYTGSAGVFCSSYDSGSSNGIIGFRVVLCP